MLEFWDGLSSFGGLLGGILAAVLFFRIRGVPLSRYGDAFAVGIPTGWAIARIGCFLVHDHPGRLTGFPLAVAFPGGARHDLGLYEAVVLFAIAGLLWRLWARRRLEGGCSACSPSSTARRLPPRLPPRHRRRLRRRPVRRAHASPVRVDPARRLGGVAPPSSSRYLIGMAILVVEDDPGIRQGIADFLGFEGYAVDVAVNGEEALSYLRAGARRSSCSTWSCRS